MPTRLDASVQAMAEAYPQFAYEKEIARKGPVGVWRGRVQPIKTLDRLNELLDDLAHDRPVYVVGDQLRHLDSCEADHCHHEWMDKSGDLRTAFDLEMRYDGGIAIPRCLVVAPPIPTTKRRHMWSDGAVCAFFASDRVWLWHKDTIATFLPHVLIWLVKWQVFDSTEHWIGAQYEANPVFHFTRIGSKELCWCGSGAQYRKCHRTEDMLALGFRRVRHR